MWLESASTELRAGRPVRALDHLDAGIAMFERDPRKKAFGEAAMWYSKRGAAYAAIGSPARAEADLRKALASEGRGWVHGRSHLELGKLADLSGNRTAALAEYRRAVALCGADRDPVAKAEAERHLDKPYSGTKTSPRRQ
jgi:tetratricopeptide (TPR) repeat protein